MREILSHPPAAEGAARTNVAFGFMPPGGSAHAASEIGEVIVAAARGWIGTPFHWEASLKGVGCDCKGLIAGVARECGRAEGDSIEALLGGYSRRIDAAALAAGLARLFMPVLRDAPNGAPQDERFFDRLLPGDVLLLAVGAQRVPVHLAISTGATMIHTYSKGPEMVIEVPMGRVWRDAVVGAWRWKSFETPPAAAPQDDASTGSARAGEISHG